MVSIRTRFRSEATVLAREWRQARARHPHLITILAAVVVSVVCASAVGSVWFLGSLWRGLPDDSAIVHMGQMDETTTVFDVHDKLAFTIYKEQRIDVPLSQISPRLIRAVISIEDQRFYDHRGFDVLRIASAALTNIRHGRAAQGGSTITQQLARQSFLTTDKTLRRKLQELILAERIERRYSKPEILQLYLNKIYFGDGLYGVEAAARGYFGKHASEVSVAEAALLAGLVKSPSSYAPTVSPERAVARRNVVLQAMLDNGAITRAEFQAARGGHVELHDSLRSDEPHGEYFKEQVRIELINRFGWQRVYQGGLRVFATIDMAMQESAEAAVADSLKALDARRKAVAARRAKSKPADDSAQSDAPLQAALVSMDPKSGQVRAMVGGRDFEQSRFNRAVQAHRQPGSAFKPFVYAAALEAGYTPATVIDHLNDPIPTLQGAWAPEDEHSSADSMNLRTGLRTSSNRVAVRLLQQVGIPQTVQYAKNMGVGNMPSVPSLALGSGEVTLESLTAAYAAFANHGMVPKPLLIRRVEDKEGQVLFTADETSTRAISETTAYLMSNMLADVINAGTGAGARRLGFTLPAAGKTGTTNDFNDAWFVGFTPSVVTGVWVGFDQPRTILPNGFAADVAVPLWATFMKAATKGDRSVWLDPPPGIVSAQVCRLSGKLATEGCDHVDVVDDDGHVDRRSMVYTEYFARGTEPKGYCDLHPTHGFFGAIATIFHGGERPAPIHLEDTGLPPAPRSAMVTPSPAAAPPAVPSADPPKKRGFFARLLGLGKK
jgi:penicillin-binding protein 1A